ncbi:hypothetical protein [Nocardia jiangsuensis]|uniref:PH (Pleckstrin Homology) domain-containing protein n=1 Tax=Nocardia jiangsuensis TaxID=1691563 RepID=A0ABV8DUS0_9NOCA
MTIGALAVCAAWAPFADPDQLGGLAAVALGILGYSGVQLAFALGWIGGAVPAGGQVRVRRVRQQHRLVSRSWLEIEPVAESGGGTRWVPVFFDPALVLHTERVVPAADALGSADGRLFPSGRVRRAEPPGQLVDNPSRPDPDAVARAGLWRRLVLDAQSAVAAPFAALFWVYVAGGGLAAFAAAGSVGAVAALWLAAVSGSDPS